MTNEEFRDFVLSSISDRACFDLPPRGFSLRQSFDDYLVIQRSILGILSRDLGVEYRSSYDFNVKKSAFFPSDVTV
jgi:hypothetical protein